MTAENITTETSSDPWLVTPAIRAKALEVGKIIKRINKEQEKMTPNCPDHPEEKGEFIERRGAYTRVKLAFKCPKGHDFLL